MRVESNLEDDGYKTQRSELRLATDPPLEKHEHWVANSARASGHLEIRSGRSGDRETFAWTFER